MFENCPRSLCFKARSFRVVALSFFLTLLCAAFFSTEKAFAWGYGHDVVATLLRDYLPDEIKPFFSDEDLKLFIKYCHYPDLPNKTLEQTGDIVGDEDEAILKEFGYSHSDWLHRHTGRAASYVLLRKAFRDKNPRNAAFYLSVLSHSIADQGAMNHTPILQFITYSRFEGIDYGVKNHLDLSTDPTLRQKIDQRLEKYEPKLLADSFVESVYSLVLDCYDQAELSADVEKAVGFGTKEEHENAMAQLAAFQVKTLLDMSLTAWKFANSEEVFTKDMLGEIFVREEARKREGRLETQTVYSGLFDQTLNPENPRATIGLVLEPYGSFHYWALSYVGKLLTASCGRTLRDHGYAVKAISFWKMEVEPLPNPSEMPVLLIFSGHSIISPKIVDAINQYVERGGKLLFVAGYDHKNLTGMKKFLQLCENEEVPVSKKWAIQNEDVWPKMSVSFAPKMTRLSTHYADGKPKAFSFMRNPNFDGFCKPYCGYRIQEDDSLQPLAWLTNEKETFCVAAMNSNAVLIPEYLMLPFLFSEDKTLRWDELRLDSFAEKVLFDTIELLCPEKENVQSVQP